MIPKQIKIKNDYLPDHPGVYFYYDAQGKLMYIGKATSLKKRVGSYFTKAHDARIAELVHRIARIDYIEVPTVIEALVLEANQIKAHKPPFNILQRDDKSFLYLVITNEDFPKPEFMRGLDLERLGIDPFTPKLSSKAEQKFKAIYGPYTSGRSVRLALDLIRRSIPWTTCQPPSVTGKTKACFYRHLHQCPGVCTGEISKRDYGKIIKNLMLFFEGKKERIVKQLRREMQAAAKKLDFEHAAELKRQVFALGHIQDIALVTHDEPLPYVRSERDYINILGRIEGYDISNISGTSAVGSMVVFEDGKPLKSAYRKFKIKTVKGSNDFAMMEEVLRRRLARAAKGEKGWPLPELMVIDGGKGQVGRVQDVLDEMGLKVPIVGLAKGFDRKQDVLVLDESNKELKRVVTANKEILQRLRDESHRFAVAYHRKLRSKNFRPSSGG